MYIVQVLRVLITLQGEIGSLKKELASLKEGGEGSAGGGGESGSTAQGKIIVYST